MSAYRNNLIEQVKSLKRLASTPYAFAAFVQDDGAGHVIPLLPGSKVEGLCLQAIDSTNPNYAQTNADLPVDGVAVTVDRFLIDIVGTAIAAMVGRVFDIESGDSGTVQVAPVTLAYGTLTGTFAVGEIIKQTTGAGAGTTAVVISDNGSSSMTFQTLSPVGAGFSAGSTIVGQTSAATAVIGSTPATPTQFKLERFINATTGEFSVLPTAAV